MNAHADFNVPSAIRLANKMADYDIYWFEEPVPAESWKALKQVRGAYRRSVSPSANACHTRWEFVPIFENGLADFVMPDVTWTGGISELKKIGTMAEAYYIPLSPHDASGPVNLMAGAQVKYDRAQFLQAGMPPLRSLWLQHLAGDTSAF